MPRPKFLRLPRPAVVPSLLFASLLASPLALATPLDTGTGTGTEGTPPAGLRSGEAERPVLLAQQRKKKKKKPRDDDPGDFGPDGLGSGADDDSGVGVHREQEGNDVPYKAEITLNTDLSFLSTEVEGSDSDPVDSTTIDLGVEWLFVLKPFEIGPDVRFSSDSTASSVTTVDAAGKSTTEVVETTTSGYSIGGLFKWNFGDLDHALLVPFAYGGIGYRAAESKSGDADAVKTSGLAIRAGGGVNIFLDSNVAFNPRAEFRMETDKGEGEDAVESTTTGLKVLVGIAVFI
jgi:hypothetical protein